MGATPAWVYLQYPPEQSEDRVARGRELCRLAREYGFHGLCLDGDAIYPPGRDWRELILAPWDDHPNPEGHEHIAAELWRQLVAHEDELGLGLGAPTR